MHFRFVLHVYGKKHRFHRFLGCLLCHSLTSIDNHNDLELELIIPKITVKRRLFLFIRAVVFCGFVYIFLHAVKVLQQFCLTAIWLKYRDTVLIPVLSPFSQLKVDQNVLDLSGFIVNCRPQIASKLHRYACHSHLIMSMIWNCHDRLYKTWLWYFISCCCIIVLLI